MLTVRPRSPRDRLDFALYAYNKMGAKVRAHRCLYLKSLVFLGLVRVSGGYMAGFL